jgi:UDP-N-acetylglucosamine diphosphorylase / glucose-1-phosphate thymidylyltransferase / UDP-N-acetylgalactosamine diphosphorylase / glucosamine-1-phosphate N-acetyltransferase / galactosamine-1-phosphate N-acetyltransferase
MHVCLYEDAVVADLEPLTLTRPVFELLCGLTTLGAKQRRFAGSTSASVLIRPHLAEVHRLTSPNTFVFGSGEERRSEPTLLINGRWLPPLHPRCTASTPCVGLVADEVAYVLVDPDDLASLTFANLEESLAHWCKTLPCHQAGGRLVRRLWELVQQNGQEILHDWQQRGVRKPGMLGGLPAIVGPDDHLMLDLTARVDPMVVVDTTGGPVIIEGEAVISAFTRIEGPCVIGRRCEVLGAKIRAGTTLGPQCRIGGEVEASIVQGHSNKYHEGFLGHAYVGEWVNLGAGTHNSDLRNDYGEVSVTVNGRVTRTGQNKVGCFLGDHTKTGLGTLLNTGTNAGVFTNLLPGGLAPKYIPSFASYWNQRLVDRTDIEELFRTAAEVMRRRGAVFTEAHATLYRNLFEQTAGERQRALRDAELRQLRKSA